ncbi:MAG: hypothetical protein HKL85_07155 [Acidimicrobiaceae bacterium]|nr:hypothetical protein [Acidimicrobiaceae bacterium]
MAAGAFQELVSHVEWGQPLELFPTGKATNVARTIWSTCHCYISLELFNINFSNKPDETYARLLIGLRNSLAT